ncbi:hypothetical protein ES705_10660 [subsurface metagenome]
MGATVYQNGSNRTIDCQGTTFDIVFYGTGTKNILTNYGPTFYINLIGSYLSGGLHYMRRTFVDFNIPDFPDAVNFIKLWLYISDNSMGIITGDVCIQKGNHVYIPCQISDYSLNENQDDLFSNVDLYGLGTGWFEFPFNEAGITYLKAQRDGVAKLCYRGHRDFWYQPSGSTYTDHVYAHTAQHPSYPPYLEIDYQAGKSRAFILA